MKSSMTQHHIMLLTLLSIFIIGCSVMEQPLATKEDSLHNNAKEPTDAGKGANSLAELKNHKQQNRPLDEVTIAINSRQQPPNMKVGDRVDVFGAIALNRSQEYVRVLEAVEILVVGDPVEGQFRGKKYGSIVIGVKPDQTSLLFDVQLRVIDRKFSVTRRAPGDTDRHTKSEPGEVNPVVLELLGLE